MSQYTMISLLLGGLFFSALSGAQIPDDNPASSLNFIKKQGSLATIKYYPSGNRLVVETAGLDVQARVQGNTKPLKLEKGDGFYEIRQDLKKPYTLEVEVKKEGRKEKHQLQVR